LGLTKPDAQVYIFLGKKGAQKGKDIAKALKMSKQHLYLVLKNLQSIGIVNATLERPAKFSALPFEKALDLFVKAKMDEAQRIEGDKNEILSDWQSISLVEAADQSPKFTVIEGRNYIYPRLKQMIEETKSQLLLISTVQGLMRADQFGLLDVAFNHASKMNMKSRFLIEVSEENLKSVKTFLEKMPKLMASFEGRTPELGFKLSSRMLIRDDVEAALFVGQELNKTVKEMDDLCLWTNSKAIVNSFRTVFEEIWRNSIDIKEKIIEIETGKPTPKTLIFREPEEARQKFSAAIASAEKEIIIVTSAEGLEETLADKVQLRERVENGVMVKIMAPITRSNLQTALLLSEFCMVRHVSTSYLNTTVIDRKQLFQFKYRRSVQKNPIEATSFENTYYTNDSDYVEKINRVLDSVWENSYPASAVTIEDITKPPRPAIAPVPDDEFSVSRKGSSHQKNIIGVEEKPRVVTEEYVLNKIINSKRIPVRILSEDTVYLYGSWATAVFHPPTSFNLPDLIIVAIHCNKQSSFGGSDSLQIHAWLETPNGHTFVPVATIGDNPEGVEWAKAYFAGTPAAQNCRVIRKDELQIQVHGNTVFAGWTVPIPLFPPKYILPPACLLVEGYGKIKTSVITFSMPTGTTAIMESNGFDGFATFFHPASKYAGPGTDATVSREMIMTAYPPRQN
jgi:HTH-type transcriptional regulator, sugar sensing transcriptional regulator